MRKLMMTLATAAMALTGAPSQAATTILTFDSLSDPSARPACGGATVTRFCEVETESIGADYGSTAELAISYERLVDPLRTGTSTISNNLIFLNPSSNGAGSSFGSVDDAGRIIFTPTAGYKFSFAGFDAVNRNDTSPSTRFTLTDLFGMTIFDFTSPVLAGRRTSFVTNTAFFDRALVFQFKDGQFNGQSVDNIFLNTVLAVPPGGVPEPASWALMIAGFGLTGSAMRRRKAFVKPVLA
jgi:hypothetical protein